MTAIAERLRDQQTIEALALDRVTRLGLPEAVDEMRRDLGERAAEVVRLTNEYNVGGSRYMALEKIRKLRHERLAHRQVTRAKAAARIDSPDEKEIEEIYTDTAALLKALCSLVNAEAYDPKDSAGVYGFYAEFFWAAARGERTEGHPSYRAPPAE